MLRALKKLFQPSPHPKVRFGPMQYDFGHASHLDVFIDGERVGELWRYVGYIPAWWVIDVDLREKYNITHYEYSSVMTAKSHLIEAVRKWSKEQNDVLES